jgi:hypothetical protein
MEACALTQSALQDAISHENFLDSTGKRERDSTPELVRTNSIPR